MVIITRKPGQRIRIGRDVIVTVIGTGPDLVRFGIEAPKDVPVDREEIHVRKKSAAAHAAGAMKKHGCFDPAAPGCECRGAAARAKKSVS